MPRLSLTTSYWPAGHSAPVLGTATGKVRKDVLSAQLASADAELAPGAGAPALTGLPGKYSLPGEPGGAAAQ